MTNSRSIFTLAGYLVIALNGCAIEREYAFALVFSESEGRPFTVCDERIGLCSEVSAGGSSVHMVDTETASQYWGDRLGEHYIVRACGTSTALTKVARTTPTTINATTQGKVDVVVDIAPLCHEHATDNQAGTPT